MPTAVGGDPLAAAIAAGETPSPEMVAAAGGEGALSLRSAWMLLGGVGMLIAAVVLMVPYSTDLGIAPSDRSPAVLRQQAKEINAKFGYGQDAADSAEWLSRDYLPLRYLADHMKAPGCRRKYKELGPPLLYALRQSPRPLSAPSIMFAASVTENSPPMEVSGMTFVGLDGSGRLRKFRAVPPQIEPAGKAGAEFDWPPLFIEAGLDAARFKRVEPQWIPPTAFDERSEWAGSAAELPEMELRVSAAAFRGKLVHFEVLGPWSRPERMETRPLSAGARIAATTFAIMILGLLAAMLFFVRRNLRQGRGDKTGGFRISAFVFVIFLIQGMLASHHAGDLASWAFQVLMPVLAFSMFFGGFFWLLYIALEPYLRRRMPELLIGWARLLEGRLGDPRIGRDVLIGALFGAAYAVVAHVVNGLSSWFPFQIQTDSSGFPVRPGRSQSAGLPSFGFGNCRVGTGFQHDGRVLRISRRSSQRSVGGGGAGDLELSARAWRRKRLSGGSRSADRRRDPDHSYRAIWIARDSGLLALQFPAGARGALAESLELVRHAFTGGPAVPGRRHSLRFPHFTRRPASFWRGRARRLSAPEVGPCGTPFPVFRGQASFSE